MTPTALAGRLSRRRRPRRPYRQLLLPDGSLTDLSERRAQSAPRTLTVADLETIYAGGRGLAWPISGDRTTAHPVPAFTPRTMLSGPELNAWAHTYQPQPDTALLDT